LLCSHRLFPRMLSIVKAAQQSCFTLTVDYVIIFWLGLMLSLDQCLLIEMLVFEVVNASLIALSLNNALVIEMLLQVWHALNVVLTWLPVRQLYKHLVRIPYQNYFVYHQNNFVYHITTLCNSRLTTWLFVRTCFVQTLWIAKYLLCGHLSMWLCDYTNFVLLIDFVNNKPVNHLRIDSFLETKVVKEAGVFDSQANSPSTRLNTLTRSTGRPATLRNTMNNRPTTIPI